MCLRSISTLSAAGLCAEIGDFQRLAHPEQVMSYLGVVPSEHSSGTQRCLGPITKSGSQHARRLLVEAAWHYRRRRASPTSCGDARPAPTPPSSRSRGRPNAGCITSGNRMEQRGKRKTIIAVAAARELAGFCWAVATAD